MRLLLMRTVLVVLATAFLAACTNSGSDLTADQRDRLAEEYMDGPLSD